MEGLDIQAPAIIVILTIWGVFPEHKVVGISFINQQWGVRRPSAFPDRGAL